MKLGLKPVLFHGSNKMVDIIKPSITPMVDTITPVVFATTKRGISLIFAGGRWDDRHISMGTIKGVPYIAEMYPAAIDKFFNNTAYVYNLSSRNFKRFGPEGSWEFISKKPETPIMVDTITDLQKELVKEGVRLLPFDKKSTEIAGALKHKAEHANSLSKKERDTYVKWYTSYMDKHFVDMFNDLLNKAIL